MTAAVTTTVRDLAVPLDLLDELHQSVLAGYLGAIDEVSMIAGRSGIADSMRAFVRAYDDLATLTAGAVSASERAAGHRLLPITPYLCEAIDYTLGREISSAEEAVALAPMFEAFLALRAEAAAP